MCLALLRHILPYGLNLSCCLVSISSPLSSLIDAMRHHTRLATHPSPSRCTQHRLIALSPRDRQTAYPNPKALPRCLPSLSLALNFQRKQLHIRPAISIYLNSIVLYALHLCLAPQPAIDFQSPMTLLSLRLIQSCFCSALLYMHLLYCTHPCTHYT